MMKTLLLAGVATAFAAAPAYAQQANGTLNFNNNISTSLVNNVTRNEEVRLFGTVNVNGTVTVDSSATAVTDTKQINTDQAVTFAGNRSTTGQRTAAGVNNVADAGNVNANGNVGLNSAAGQFNQQSNFATIAVASGGVRNAREEAGGMATANTTSAQFMEGTFVGAESEQDSVVFRNGAFGGNIGGNGNIKANVAAGAFNQQQNLMTLAVASNSAMATATAGVVQFSAGNLARVADSSNVADPGSITGSGNIHMNLAAGTGNQQVNALTVAASGAFGGNAVGGAGNGGQ